MKHDDFKSWLYGRYTFEFQMSVDSTNGTYSFVWVIEIMQLIKVDYLLKYLYYEGSRYRYDDIYFFLHKHGNFALYVPT